MEVRDLGIEEDVSSGCGSDAAGDEELGEDLGKAGFFCEKLGGGLIGWSESPALARMFARDGDGNFGGEEWD